MTSAKQYSREEIWEACWNNIPLFSLYFFPHHVNPNIGVPPFHEEIYRMINDRTKEFGAIIAPRGFAKTTVALLINTLHDIAYGLEHCIVLISETSLKARRDLSAIRTELEFNERFRAVFGDLTTDRKWTQDDILTKNGIYIVALGSGKQIRGLKHPFGPWRPTKIILDDPESINTNVNSPQSRQRTKDWFNSDVCFSLARGKSADIPGIIRVIGTIVHNDCLLATLKKDSRFTDRDAVLFYQAIIEKDGREESLWPEFHPLDKLKEEKRQYEKNGLGAIWLMELMNIPMTESAGFNERDLREWDGDFIYRDGMCMIRWGDMLIPIEVVTAVDLASSEKTSADFNVVMSCGMDKENNLYILDYIRKRESNPAIMILELFRQCWLYHPHTLAIETTSYQLTFSRFFDMVHSNPNILRAIMEAEEYTEQQIGQYVNIIAELPAVIEMGHHNQSKISRIKSLQPRFRAGMIKHKTWMEDFISEYKDFPEAEHDDCMDVLQMCDEIARAASVSATPLHIEMQANDADNVVYGFPRKAVQAICL